MRPPVLLDQFREIRSFKISDAIARETPVELLSGFLMAARIRFKGTFDHAGDRSPFGSSEAMSELTGFGAAN